MCVFIKDKIFNKTDISHNCKQKDLKYVMELETLNTALIIH